MFRRLDDFIHCWATESGRTLAMIEAIPDSAMATAVAPEHRDLRRLAWHLVESLIEMPGHLGLAITGKELIQGTFIGAPPATMAEVRAAYQAASDSLLNGLRDWQDADLEREDDLYGERWKRGFTLFVLVTHQAHHRGQMSVLVRQAGLRVPEVYGPAKEGWAAYGMAAPEV